MSLDSESLDIMFAEWHLRGSFLVALFEIEPYPTT